MKRAGVAIAVLALLLAGGFAIARAAENDTVAYLGVATQAVDEGLRQHLGLPEGVGLRVTYIDDASAADGVLQPGDVLTRFEDQWLTSHRQLAVLVRRHKPGDEVKLALVRQGKEDTVQLRLGEHAWTPLPPAAGEGVMPMMPGQCWQMRPRDRMTPRQQGMKPPRAGVTPDQFKNRLDRLMQSFGMGEMSMDQLFQWMQQDQPFLPPGPGRLGDRMRSQITEHTTSVRTEVRNGVTATLSTTDGERQFKVTDKDGKVLFEGPVNTQAQIDAIPQDVRDRFQRITEDLHVQVNPQPDVVPPPDAL